MSDIAEPSSTAHALEMLHAAIAYLAADTADAADDALPARMPPDCMDDETWEAVCAATAAGGEPPGLGEDDEDPAEDVPLAELSAQADADGAEEAALRARLLAAGLGDGFAHARGEPPLPGAHNGPAAGFGQGMPLDAAAPCTMLSGLADEASGEDRSFAGITDDELLGLMSARRRLEARQAWETLMAVAEFIRRRPGPGCVLEGSARMPRAWSEHACAELAAQLAVTGYEADWLLGLAHDLAVKLPMTAAALRDGVIDVGKARVVAGWCTPLTAAEAGEAEAIVFADPDVAAWTATMLRDRIIRAVMEVNPEAARRRREQAAKSARVEVGAELSGNAMLAGRELPPTAVAAASQGLTARARQLRTLGVPGGVDQRRALALLEALGVLDPLAGLGGENGPDGGGDGQEDGVNGGRSGDGGGSRGDGSDGGAGPGGGPAPAGGRGASPGAVPAGFAAKVNLTIPLATLLGLAERPGMMARTGPVDPALARDLAAGAAGHPATTWCMTVTGPDGRPVSHGCGRPAGNSRRSQQECGRPGAAARDGPLWYRPDDDHGPPGGHGTIGLNPAGLTGAGGGRELAFALEPLAGPCDHAHQAAGHDPGVMLRHLTGILNATCTFPPCRRPQHQADYEHSTPFDRGGKTCLCQAGPVCRRNHQDKQAAGWHLEAAGNRGWFRWATPSGRTYLSRPTQYPD